MHDDLAIALPPKELAFLDAARNGDVTTLRELRAQGVPVDLLDNREQPWGQTALMHAAAGGQLAAVRFLLAAGAKVSAKDKGGGEMEQNRVPLHYAAQSNNPAVAEALLAAGANPNVVSHYGDTPLNVAVRAGHIEVAQLLLRHGADVKLKARAKRYTPPLCAAADSGQPALLRLLLDAGAEVNAANSLQETPLICVNYAGDDLAAAMTANLLKAGADMEYTDSQGRTALSLAVIEQHSQVARILLKAGANPNRNFARLRGTLLDVIEQRVNASQKDIGSAADQPTGAETKRLQSWQAMLDLFREFGAKRASEL